MLKNTCQAAKMLKRSWKILQYKNLIKSHESDKFLTSQEGYFKVLTWGHCDSLCFKHMRKS